MSKTEKSNTIYVHSGCCNAHWELVVIDGKAGLYCENCGKSAGTKVVIKIAVDDSKCDCCADKK